MITVRLAEPLRDGRGELIAMNASSLGDIIRQLGIDGQRDELYNFTVNGEMILHGENEVRLQNGDEVEILVAFSGG